MTVYLMLNQGKHLKISGETPVTLPARVIPLPHDEGTVVSFIATAHNMRSRISPLGSSNGLVSPILSLHRRSTASSLGRRVPDEKAFSPASAYAWGYRR